MGPEHFLNGASDISNFVSTAQTAGFLVGRAPPCVRDLICAELERQNVPHNAIQTTTSSEAQYLVRLGDSAFLCQEAVAEFPD